MPDTGDQMTTLDHLRALVESSGPRGAYCTACNADGYIISGHRPDCRWVAAKGFVEDIDRKEIERHEEARKGYKHNQKMATIEEEAELSEEEFEMFKKIRNYASFALWTCHPSVQDEVVRDLQKANSMINRRGFTLIELLVVIAIITFVSVLTIPTISGALSHRQVGEAARLVQASLAGARDAAIRDNAPSGIRLIQDPLFSGIQPLTINDPATGLPIANPSPFAGRLDPGLPLAYNRIVPIAPAPSYQDGAVIQVAVTPGMFGPLGALAQIGALAYPVPSPAVPSPLVGATTVLVLAEAVITQVFGPNGQPQIIPNPPTSWFWNIRLGDKVQLNNAGPWYTVVGPMVVPPQGATINGQFMANPELFVNVGQPGAPLPWTTTQFGQSVTPEFLLIVNGRDDNANGWIDEGWDGVDNDGFNGVDDVGEWRETETWLGAPPSSTQQTYTIQRRPTPQINAREVQLPSDVVIDATTWATTQERSRLPINQFTGQVDILINPDGTAVPTTLYSSPSSVGMSGAFYHFWLSERQDLMAATGTTAPTLPIGIIDPQSVAPAAPYAGPRVKGNMWLLTLFGRTGQTTGREPGFDDPAGPAFGTYSVNTPFLINMQTQ
jgi:prepilin-type N-terminal cleavage/methylation domain-containing protein